MKTSLSLWFALSIIFMPTRCNIAFSETFSATNNNLQYLYHCRENGGCPNDESPLSINSDIVTNNQLAVRWSGWKSSSPILRYKLMLFSMTLTNGILSEVLGTANLWTTDGSNTQTTLTIPSLSSGVYSLILEVTSQAGNQSCARKLLMIDQDSSILSINPKNFFISSAIEATNYEWMRVNKADVTFVQASLEAVVSLKEEQLQAWIASSLSPYSCGGKRVSELLDNQSVKQSMYNMLSQKGLTRTEYDEEVAKDEGRDFQYRANSGKLTSFTVDAESSLVLNRTVSIQPGDTYVIAVRLVDSYGRSFFMQTRSNAVSTGPSVNQPRVDDNNDLGNDVCEISIQLNVMDVIAGIKIINWTMYVPSPDVERAILQTGSALRPEDDRRRISPLACIYAEICYCPKASSGQVRSMGCFETEYTITVDIANCSLVKTAGAIYMDIDVVSYGGLEEKRSIRVWYEVEIPFPYAKEITGGIIGGIIILVVIITCGFYIKRKVESDSLPSARGSPIPVYSQSFVDVDKNEEISVITGVHALS